MRMVSCAPQPSLEPASCCIVDVVKGGFGRSVRGESSIDLTVSGSPFKESVNFVAAVSSRSKMLLSDFSFTAPLESKSFVVATRLPSIVSRRALKPASHWAVRSHQAEEMKAIRSRSRSTINRVATDCTRPAEMRGITFFQSTGERRYPKRRSSTRRVSWASTNCWSISRVSFTAFRIASLVISLKTIRRTGTLGRRISIKCQAIASPSRSSSVARISSSASFKSSFSSATFCFLSGLIT